MAETKMAKLIIDDVEYQVPDGMNLVDAAKLGGIDIPVFCYHPKLGAVANCRMCLVEMATPRPNRETGELELAWFPGVQTACNKLVSDGMVVRTLSEAVVSGRREILEFLLSSHPLDCPICDKGGECPLQNLTMQHGPGTSRMYWNDKMRLGKHVPLGELIYLDQERCIHCARCIRFQEYVVDEPVLGFDYRGRKQRIITNSEPGFDSAWSGNTTDICPVGALTTADFRFNARPWEMVAVASLDTHFPEGANIVFDTRTDRLKGGITSIKRVLPRQNEWVNEIWINDKTRFVHHYMQAEDRLKAPLMRKNGGLVEVTWEEALQEVAARFQAAGANVAAVAGPRLSNEDYYSLQKLVRARGGADLAAYPDHLAGAEIAAKVGVGVGTNLLELGQGDAIVVIASDLYNEAPIWWLRAKQAAERGVGLILVNGRPTRLEKYASDRITYAYGQEAAALDELAQLPAFQNAQNVILFVGAEGLTPELSQELTQAAANLLISTGHYGKPNNGLVMVWPGANLQGAHDMGFSSAYGPGYAAAERTGRGLPATLEAFSQNDLRLLLIAEADLAFDDATYEEALRASKGTLIVMDMFLTRTAALADIVLPLQSVAERDGTFTSGERRVQRFYQALEAIGESKATWEIAQLIALKLDASARVAPHPSTVFGEIVREVPQYSGLSYPVLARVVKQFPDVGGDDLYFGGTQHENKNGIGVQWPTSAEQGVSLLPNPATVPARVLKGGDDALVIVPVKSLYDREMIMTKSTLLDLRVPQPYVALNPATAAALGLAAGDEISVPVGTHSVAAFVEVDEDVPAGVGVMPRRLQAQGAPAAPVVVAVTKLERELA